MSRPREGGFESISPVLARMLSGLRLEERFASAQATACAKLNSSVRLQ